MTSPPAKVVVKGVAGEHGTQRFDSGRELEVAASQHAAARTSPWTQVPEEVLRLPEQLARVDALLDDPAVLRSVRAVLLADRGPAVDADGVLPAADVPQVPVPAGL